MSAAPSAIPAATEFLYTVLQHKLVHHTVTSGTP